MKRLLITLCVAISFAGCLQRVAGDAELSRVYKYIFIDAGFSLRLNTDHSYVYDYYFPVSIPDSSERPEPPKGVGMWKREAKEIVLTSSTGQIRRLEIIRKDGKIVLIEHITQKVVNTYY